MAKEKAHLIRLEYFPSDGEDISNELELLKSIGYKVIIDNDFEYSKTRKEIYKIITLRRYEK